MMVAMISFFFCSRLLLEVSFFLWDFIFDIWHLVFFVAKMENSVSFQFGIQWTICPPFFSWLISNYIDDDDDDNIDDEDDNFDDDDDFWAATPHLFWSALPGHNITVQIEFPRLVSHIVMMIMIMMIMMMMATMMTMMMMMRMMMVMMMVMMMMMIMTMTLVIMMILKW